MPTTAERQEVLDGIADEVLTEKAETAILAQERQDNANAEAERVAALRVNLQTLEAERLEAVARAEKGFREGVAGVADVMKFSTEMREVIKQMHRGVPLALDGVSAKRRLSERLAAVFKPLTGPSARYGQVEFKTTWRQPGQDWVADERSCLIEELTKLLKGATR